MRLYFSPSRRSMWILLMHVLFITTRAEAVLEPAPPVNVPLKPVLAGVVSNNPAAFKIVTPTAPDTNLPPLTGIVQLRDLSAREASRAYPIRVTGVVTFYDPLDYKHFIQDDSAGVYFALATTNLDPRLDQGQKVEVEGFSGPGGYAPILHATQIRVLGKAPYPAARSSTIQSLMTGNEDSTWVALKGVIHSQTVTNNRTTLALWTGEAAINITVPHASEAPAPINFVDAAVEIHGVCGTIFNERRRLQEVQLHVPDWTQVEVRERGPNDPFGLPLQAINELLEFHAGLSGLHRSHISGQLIHLQGQGSFFVQDSSGGILVQSKEPLLKLPAGSFVEIAGFPALSEGLPVLQNAIVKPLSQFSPVKPTPLRAESILNDAYHATLVQLDGRVISHSTRPAEEILTVDLGNSVIDAFMEREGSEVKFAAIVPGTVVRLTGIYIAELDSGRQIRAFHLLMRSISDLAQISRPPWWTIRHTILVLAGLAAILLGSVVWLRVLQTEVRRRTLELSQEIEEHKRTGAKLQKQSGRMAEEVERRKQAQSQLESKQATLEKEIEERRQAEEALKKTHTQLLAVSRQAGMAEVATNVLHNVGNVLNSVNVSSNLVSEQMRRSKVASLEKVCELLRRPESDLSSFLVHDPKGRQIPAYLNILTEHLATEQNEMLAELALLQKNVGHIKDIVAMQQNYAKVSGLFEKVKVSGLVDDAVQMIAGPLARQELEMCFEYEAQDLEISTDKSKVLQILVNLIRNAGYACAESKRANKRVIIRVASVRDTLQIQVIDNGIGICEENLFRIFNHGFTTRPDGHGFGLHSGALAARELGGSLIARSDGLDKGAVFTLALPLHYPLES